jgi:cardiolipin synthase
MSYVDDIMSAGVRVFLYEKGFSHSKLIISDGKFCSIGTANMDVRSFEHNFEINALFYDEEFTQLLEREFLHDLRNSTEVNHKEWKNRPRKEKFMENTCRLLAPLL